MGNQCEKRLFSVLRCQFQRQGAPGLWRRNSEPSKEMAGPQMGSTWEGEVGAHCMCERRPEGWGREGVRTVNLGQRLGLQLQEAPAFTLFML